MGNMSSEMQEVLAQVAEEFSAAEVFSNWLPPDGTYTALITGYKDGVKVKGTTKTAWWTLDGRLLVPNDVELNEKECNLGIFRSSAVGILKGAMAVLAGRKIDDVRQAAGILAGSVGWVVTIRVRTTPPKDEGGIEYRNVSIIDVVQKDTTS